MDLYDSSFFRGFSRGNCWFWCLRANLPIFWIFMIQAFLGVFPGGTVDIGVLWLICQYFGFLWFVWFCAFSTRNCWFWCFWANLPIFGIWMILASLGGFSSGNCWFWCFRANLPIFWICMIQASLWVFQGELLILLFYG